VAESPRSSRPTLLSQMLRIAAKEFGDRFRCGWVIAAAAVWIGAICLTSFFGLIQIGQLGVQGYERTVISLLNLIQYLAPLLGLLMGHDLLVSEREDRTLALILSTGVSRDVLLAGKFLGGVVTISFPLVLGFIISGVVIGLNASASGLLAFTKLAVSGLALAILFTAAGLAISTFARTRVQALVLALLAWCAVVFVFDLAVLGALLAAKVPQAAQEIEVACDATHVNSMADIHNAFDQPGAGAKRIPVQEASSFSWILLNPVDLFRATNLPPQPGLKISTATVLSITGLWVGGLLAFACWRFRSQDL
jgi:Cu-processing system permease protein